jgi:hypothetical protein
MTPNELTPAEQADGFKLIFDGKTTQGWRNFGKEVISEQVEVIDGTLVITGGCGDIITEEQYGDFELRLQYLISPDGNSGVMWRVTEEKDRSYETGPEFQILDSFAKNNYAPELARGNIAGALYDLVPAKPEWSKPANEWNDVSIRVVGARITLALNGNITADVDTSTAEWTELLAKSKFADWPLFNKASKGHICLQDHDDRVAFRSIRIKSR